MWNKLIIIFNTVRYLKFIQIFYQLWYRVKKIFPFHIFFSAKYHNIHELVWEDKIYNLNTYVGSEIFSFINLTHDFKEEIDWNFSKNKKLWTYNLNYFDFLNQASISKEEGEALINSFVENYDTLKDGKESYPTSLRIINFVKFISKHHIKKRSFLNVIKKDTKRLSDNLEYHLLANHLLENGFALWFAAHLFHDQKLLLKSKDILTKQLNEQVLKDGAHFELSPMYHQLMLYRVLDCINLSESNNFADIKTIYFFRDIASKMTSWLKQITFECGTIPLFNDAANEINPTSKSLFNYSKELRIQVANISLKESGYRKLKGEKYELIVDVGEVGPSYQPGHAHADTFNFELYVKNQPILVDSGTSTYNISVARSEERSTKAHNTVTVNDKNSSQVWSGFRVANRAHVTSLFEKNNILKATHSGYKNYGVLHQRTWEYSINEIIIKDKLIGKEVIGKAYFHFHPSANILKKENGFLINQNIHIFFNLFHKFRLVETTYSPQFNVYHKNKTLEISFKNSLKTNIKIN